MNVRKVKVTVAQAEDGSYWCHTESDVYGSGLNGAGATVKEAKSDLMKCLGEAREEYELEGRVAYPVEFTYKYDLQSFFEYFSFFNVSDIARRAGINPTLMRQYASGVKNAGEKTYERLSACMEQIKSDLSAACFSI